MAIAHERAARGGTVGQTAYRILVWETDTLPRPGGRTWARSTVFGRRAAIADVFRAGWACQSMSFLMWYAFRPARISTDRKASLASCRSDEPRRSSHVSGVLIRSVKNPEGLIRLHPPVWRVLARCCCSRPSDSLIVAKRRVALSAFSLRAAPFGARLVGNFALCRGNHQPSAVPIFMLRRIVRKASFAQLPIVMAVGAGRCHGFSCGTRDLELRVTRSPSCTMDASF
jgi:hypothetical protein